MQPFFHIHIAKLVDVPWNTDKYREYLSFDLPEAKDELDKAKEKLADLRMRFPPEDGFKVTMTFWRWLVVDLDDELPKPRRLRQDDPA
jgi:hypothetical protein